MDEARVQLRSTKKVSIECGRCNGTGEGDGEGKACSLCHGRREIEIDPDPVEPLA